jgi:DNA-directed RNA polymerase specialized sigma24 family protein
MQHSAQATPTAELAAGCRHEIARFRRGERSSCAPALELFRRAICARDELAWAAIVAEYSHLVRAWVRQNPVTRHIGEDDDFLVSGTFARFWAAVKPEGWHNFTNLAAVLRYLKLCAHSLVLDTARAERRGPTVSLDSLTDVLPDVQDVEEDLLADLAARELWGVILGLLPDETERLVAYLSFVRAIKPGEIQNRHPERFASVGDVYRIKRNVLERLHRSPALRRAAR